MMQSAAVTVSPMRAVRAPASPMEAATAVGTAPMSEAVLDAALTPPGASLALWEAPPAVAAVAAAAGAWETLLRE